MEKLIGGLLSIDAFWVYEAFNRLEGVAWMVVAMVLPFVVRRTSRRQTLSVLAASMGFVLFGLTDFWEAPLRGQIPTTLWGAKIFCGAFLLGCRAVYVGREQFRLTDRFFLFGIFCLPATLGVMVLQRLLYG